MTNISPEKDYLSSDEVARILRVTPWTVRELARVGKFPNAHRPGKAWMIPRSDVDNYIKEAYT